MLYKVTHCAEHVSANTKLHQLAYTHIPHGGDDVWLGKLYHDATGAKLVASVA